MSPVVTLWNNSFYNVRKIMTDWDLLVSICKSRLYNIGWNNGLNIRNDAIIVLPYNPYKRKNTTDFTECN